MKIQPSCNPVTVRASTTHTQLFSKSFYLLSLSTKWPGATNCDLVQFHTNSITSFKSLRHIKFWYTEVKLSQFDVIYLIFAAYHYQIQRSNVYLNVWSEHKDVYVVKIYTHNIAQIEKWWSIRLNVPGLSLSLISVTLYWSEPSGVWNAINWMSCSRTFTW